MRQSAREVLVKVCGGLALLLVLAPLVAAGAAHAQSSLPLVAVLLHGNESGTRPIRDGLDKGLRDLGYVPGRNVRIELRLSDNQVERLSSRARELLALKPAVIVGSPVVAAQAVHRESKTVPIVMAGGAGAQSVGLIASLARPGGNVTGVTNQGDELAGKQLEFLKDIAPRARRVATLSSGLGAAEEDLRRGSRVAAKTYGLTLIEVLADSPDKLAQVSARCERERCEALVVLLDPNIASFRAEVVAMAARLRIPAAYGTLTFVDDGGLVAYSADIRLLAQRAATYVDKILKGAKPGDLPVERPTKFELGINLKTARALGIAIPPSVLARADRVVE